MQENKGAVSNTKTGETGKDFYIEQKISSYASRIDAELLRNGKEEAAPKDSPEKGNNPRTFGLYTIPSSNLIFRKMDGVWEALFCFTRIGSSADVWKYYSTQKGKPVDKDFIESHEGLQCLTYQRPVARFLYGVPQDVELYPDPDLSIIKDPKKPHKRKGR